MAARDNGEGEDDGPGRTIYTPLDGDEWCAEDDDAEDEVGSRPSEVGAQ